MTRPVPGWKVDKDTIRRFYDAIDYRFPGDVHGGDVEDAIRDAIGWDHPYGTARDPGILTKDEMEKVIVSLDPSKGPAL